MPASPAAPAAVAPSPTPATPTPTLATPSPAPATPSPSPVDAAARAATSAARGGHPDGDPGNGTSTGRGAESASRAGEASRRESSPTSGPRAAAGTPVDQARESRRLKDDAAAGPTSTGAEQRLDVAAATGRRIDSQLVAETSGADGPAAPTAAAASGEVDRLLGRVVEQIRTVAGSSSPALEARLQDPQLGTLHLVVAGRAGEVVQAELVVADARSADALARAIDRSSAGNGLAGIDLRVRTESGLGAGSSGSGSTPDRSTRDAGPGAWAGAGGGGGFDRGPDLGRGDAGRDRPTAHTMSTLPTVPAIARRGPRGRSLDLRA